MRVKRRSQCASSHFGVSKGSADRRQQCPAAGTFAGIVTVVFKQELSGVLRASAMLG